MAKDFEVPKNRIIILIVVIVLTVFVYIMYLAKMQILNFSEYQKRAKEVSSRESIILAQRGEIYDRNYDKALVTNIPSFAISVTPGELTNTEKEILIKNCQEVFDIDEDELREKIPKGESGGFLEVELKDAITFEEITFIAEHIEDFPKIQWHIKPIRGYSEKGSISHILGYVGNITNEDLQILYNKGYNINSTIGKSGIEKQYDIILRGTDGSRMRTVDAKGRKIEENAHIIPPKNGNNLILSIDRNIQVLCEKALGNRIGSIVVMRPTNGEVLAMASYPYYDPNLFYSDNSKKVYEELSLDKRFPFLNRAIQSAYAPASTFKVIMSAAVLQERAYPTESTILCEGYTVLGNRTFHCHKKTGHGSLNLSEALAESCNVFFYNIGVEYLGIEKISNYAADFGFGKSTGIDLPGEIVGLIPTPEWKEQIYNTRWVGGDTMNISIGQGSLTVTPLQMASAFSMIANDGIMYRPHILKKVIDPTTGNVVLETEPEIIHKSNISKNNFQLLKDYLRGVITNGTAKYVITTKAVEAAGKTGTGEMGLLEQWHSWFAAFAPYKTNNPEERIVVIVCVEGVNDWEWWAPKAADIILQGIFAEQTYEEVLEEFKDRWYILELKKRQKEELEAAQLEAETEQ